jgi:predicted TIM-barrel fold metal-dependent hydrolase
MRLGAAWPALLMTASGTIVAPVADHHQHLLSPAMAVHWSAKPLKAVEVPAEIAQLLDQRTRAFGDSAALAQLFTEDGLLAIGQRTSWIRGRGPIGAQLATKTFARPYRLTPLEYRTDGASAHLAAYLSRGEGDSLRHFGQALLALRREGGSWRIGAETMTFPGVPTYEPITADSLVALLDAAGIRRAVVLSAAYIYGDPRNPVSDEYAKVRAENDWTSQQVKRFPDRLRGFCGVSPLKEYAIAELDRCVTLGLRGLKLHFANSLVDVRKLEHVERLREVFRAANERRIPIVAHLWTTDPSYGREHSEIFLNQILPVAPDIPIQIAHMAGAGPRYVEQVDRALSPLAEAVAAGDQRTRNLYFDVATNVTIETPVAEAAMLVRRLRQIGMDRIVYGSDLPVDGNPAPRQGWAIFRSMLPLTDGEVRKIAKNVAPYLR